MNVTTSDDLTTTRFGSPRVARPDSQNPTTMLHNQSDDPSTQSSHSDDTSDVLHSNNSDTEESVDDDSFIHDTEDSVDDDSVIHDTEDSVDDHNSMPGLMPRLHNYQSDETSTDTDDHIDFIHDDSSPDTDDETFFDLH